MIIGKRNRLEDLGVILIKLQGILNLPWSEWHGQPVWELVQSKHSLEEFMNKYKREDELVNLFDQLKWIRSELEELETLAIGEIE